MTTWPDCGDSSCLYAERRGGMRTNGGCSCDKCPECDGVIRPGYPGEHRRWCTMRLWLPLHHRSPKTGVAK